MQFCNKCKNKFLVGEGGFHNVFGDRPTKWPIAKNKNKNPSKHLCLGCITTNKLINKNHNKY